VLVGSGLPDERSTALCFPFFLLTCSVASPARSAERVDRIWPGTCSLRALSSGRRLCKGSSYVDSWLRIRRLFPGLRWSDLWPSCRNVLHFKVHLSIRDVHSRLCRTGCPNLNRRLFVTGGSYVGLQLAIFTLWLASPSGLLGSRRRRWNVCHFKIR